MSLVIFDLDGVIVSTDRYHYEAWQELAIQHNLYFDRDINEQLRGVGRAESLEIILKHNGKTVEDETFKTMLTEKNEIYKMLLEELDKDDILPGVLDFVASLKKANIKIAIGSSSRNAPIILDKICMSDMFDIIVDGNHISRSKPDPEVFEIGAKKLKVNYGECIVFEDAEAGIEAAKACGMIAVGVGDTYLPKSDLMLKTLEGLTYQSLCENLNLIGGQSE